MKKGDLLLCNDGVTKVELFDFDETSISVVFKGKIHRRPIKCIGETLHCINHCWNCGDEISSLFCKRCGVCGCYVCRICGSCQGSTCAYKVNGFNSEGIHRNGTKYSDDGYDRNGYNSLGYDFLGYDRNGYDSLGYDFRGYDRNGYDHDGYNREGYNRDGYDCDGINREGFDKNGCDAHWRKLNGRKVVYIEIDSQKKGEIVRCYVENGVHYVDVKFVCGAFYRKIAFVNASQSGILKLLKKKNVSKVSKPADPSIRIDRTSISQDVQEIFEERQGYYERIGGYHTSFGGCFDEDDRDSEFYNPMHPFDD